MIFHENGFPWLYRTTMVEKNIDFVQRNFLCFEAFAARFIFRSLITPEALTMN